MMKLDILIINQCVMNYSHSLSLGLKILHISTAYLWRNIFSYCHTLGVCVYWHFNGFIYWMAVVQYIYIYILDGIFDLNYNFVSQRIIDVTNLHYVVILLFVFLFVYNLINNFKLLKKNQYISKSKLVIALRRKYFRLLLLNN